MALGGGYFTSQNKILPGAYINFQSKSVDAAALTERGYFAIGIKNNWNREDGVFKVTKDDFYNNSKKIFGYDYSDEKMKGIRDLFKHAHTGFFYILDGNGTAASCEYGVATGKGTRGNDLKLVIAVNVDEPDKYNVITYLGTEKVDEQVVSASSELVDNGYITFNKTIGTKYYCWKESALMSPNVYTKIPIEQMINHELYLTYSYDDSINQMIENENLIFSSNSNCLEHPEGAGLYLRDPSGDKEIAGNGGSSNGLTPTAGISLTGGTDGTETIERHQDLMDKLESKPINALGCLSGVEEVKALYTAYQIRMREERGIKFSLIIQAYAADHEGNINLKNTSSKELLLGATAGVYWLTGAEAGCEINKTLTNFTYDGEVVLDTDYKQADLQKAIKSGELVFHNVNEEIRVLDDINSLVTLTEKKNELFKDNQTIRVIDQVAIDIASLFNDKYSGKVPNNKDGRVSLWDDIVKQHNKMVQKNAIEEFDKDGISVSEGEAKDSVAIFDNITIIGTMKKLYMQVVVR